MTFNVSEAGPITVTAGEIDVQSSGILGATTLYSNTVLKVFTGGSLAAGLTSTQSTVTVAHNGTINGAVLLQGGLLVNDGTINVTGTSVMTVTNSAIVTNNSDGTINAGNANPVIVTYPGTVFANFGPIYPTTGRVVISGLWYGTGQVYDPVNSGPENSSLARFGLQADPNAVLSVGNTPSGSIGDMTINGRFDTSVAANNNNAAGKFLVEFDIVGGHNDTIHATRWNNLGGCYWVMTNLTGNFSAGQMFNVMINAAGQGISNYVDTITLYPQVLPTVPDRGLEWNLSGLMNFGTIGVTNSTMVWAGGGNGSWDTNGSTGNWQSGKTYGDNQGAVLDDSASGSTAITLTTTVAPSGFNLVIVTNTDNMTYTNVVSTSNAPSFMPGIVVSNAAKDYTISGTGKISGMTGIYKTGSGTLTVLSTNDYIGGLTIDGGTFAMTNSTALGIANNATFKGGTANQLYNQVLINNNATVKLFGTTNQNLNHFVTINQNGATFEVSSNTTLLTLNDNVLGSGALTKTGLGTLILNQGGDLYAGGTAVNQGALLLTTTAAGTNAITLASATTLELTNGVGGTAIGMTLSNQSASPVQERRLISWGSQQIR